MSPSLGFKPLWMLRSKVSLDGLVMTVTVRGPRISILPSRLEQNAAGLGSIWWRRSQRSGHRCQAPLLDVCFNEDKASLSEIDMYGCGAVGANSGKKVWIFYTVYNVVQLLAVAGEKYATRPWPVTAADNIALHELGRIWSLVKWLVEAFETIRKVSGGVSMKAWPCNRQYASAELHGKRAADEGIPGSLNKG